MKKIITILGETLTIAFNMAVQISFEEITGKPFSDINTDSSKDNFALAYAAIIANNPDTNITADNLMRDISGAELKDLLQAISDAAVEWNEMPATLADDEDKKKDEPEEGHSYGEPECIDDTKKLLTACQQYTLLVGEIGIPRNEFLYTLRLWEINAIVKGYRRRTRENWEMTRHLGLTFCNVMGAKIDSAHDYLPLPWDDKATSKELTEEEVNQLMELMRKENEAIEKKKI